MAEREFGMLPEDCISSILCRTSPLDVFRLSLVSSTFRSAAESDSVWDTFLPSDYVQIVAKSVAPMKFSSKRELFLHLCKSIPIDDGNKIFSLEMSSGLKSYMVSAKELSIRHGNEPHHWAWKCILDSRFSEVAELKSICRLEIQGKIKTEMLSPNTKYCAYMVLKISDGAFGLDTIPWEMSIVVGNEETSGMAYLRNPTDIRKQWLESVFYGNRIEMLKSRVGGGEEREPRQREKGWMEIEIGKFLSGNGNGEEVTMSLREMKGCHLKGGLIIQGIEIRPEH